MIDQKTHDDDTQTQNSNLSGHISTRSGSTIHSGSSYYSRSSQNTHHTRATGVTSGSSTTFTTQNADYPYSDQSTILPPQRPRGQQQRHYVPQPFRPKPYRPIRRPPARYETHMIRSHPYAHPRNARRAMYMPRIGNKLNMVNTATPVGYRRNNNYNMDRMSIANATFAVPQRPQSHPQQLQQQQMQQINVDDVQQMTAMDLQNMNNQIGGNNDQYYGYDQVNVNVNRPHHGQLQHHQVVNNNGLSMVNKGILMEGDGEELVPPTMINEASYDSIESREQSFSYEHDPVYLEDDQQIEMMNYSMMNSGYNDNYTYNDQQTNVAMSQNMDMIHYI